ncbi:MAG: Gldg family protein, partial [Pseudomonadota bacterium]
MTEPSSKPVRGAARLSPASFAISALILLAILFVSIVTFSATVLKGARVDLTENQLFTLNEGTLRTLASIEEPITFRLYYSEKLAQGFPPIRLYGERIRETLEQYADRADGKLILEVIDPEPFSPEEDDAQALGVQGFRLPNSDDQLYLGLIGSNTIDGLETIPFFALERETFLEYDLTSMIYRLNTLEELKVGMVTNLPLDTGPGGVMAAMQGQSDPYAIYAQLLDLYDIEFLEQDFDAVPGDIKVLVLAHPRPLSEATLYAIDQFVLRGGRVLALLDPFSEIGQTPLPNGQPQPGAVLSSADSLGPLLRAWGVEFVDEGQSVVGDLLQAMTVANQEGRQFRYVVWLGAQFDALNRTTPLTSDLQRIQFATPGALKPVDGASTSFEPLVTSTEDGSGLISVAELQIETSPEQLSRSFGPDTDTYTFAARITGPITSAFPDGPPPPAEDDAAGTDLEDEIPDPDLAPDQDRQQVAEETQPTHLAESVSDGAVIVIADTDLLDDKFWVEIRELLGERVLVPTADNGSFVVGAVDSLSGSTDLITLRARDRTERPFTVVDALRLQAEREFQDREDRLQTRLSDLQLQLRQIQGQQGPSEAQGQSAEPTLSAQQRVAIDQFRSEIADTRLQLRAVQRELRSDIEALEGIVRFVNIGLMPILVAGFAIGLALWRREN